MLKDLSLQNSQVIEISNYPKTTAFKELIKKMDEEIKLKESVNKTNMESSILSKYGSSSINKNIRSIVN